MTNEALIRTFPTQRISPHNGMIVTAEIWQEAHAYHRQRQQLYNLFSHGPGILTGLEVEANAKADSSVCISPGIAVNGEGQVIVLPNEIKRYDFKQATGDLRLLLSYTESPPRHGGNQTGEDTPKYIHTDFVIEVGFAGAPITSAVELARVRRTDGNTAIVNASNPEHPGLNEIDTRLRREIGFTSPKVAKLAVIYVGNNPVERHGRGLSYLARTIRHTRTCQAWVDLAVSLTDALDTYTLIYLTADGNFQLNQQEMRTLSDYIGQGGTLFIESCQYNQNASPQTDRIFGQVLDYLKLELRALPNQHDLLTMPYFFAAPPPGANARGSLRIGDGVVFSTHDYGCLWQGRQGQGQAPREAIRAAMEWGTNLILYALARQESRALSS